MSFTECSELYSVKNIEVRFFANLVFYFALPLQCKQSSQLCPHLTFFEEFFVFNPHDAHEQYPPRIIDFIILITAIMKHMAIIEIRI